MKINVPHVAKLANLPLSQEEIKEFDKQLSETLEYINKLDEVDTSKVQPTSQVTGLENVTDEDVARPSLPQQTVLAGAKAVQNNFFQVKGIFDDE